MIFNIKCNNERLLDILYKNPNTDFGLYAKTLKNGVIIGNAINEHLYEVVYQDSKNSYMPEDGNQADYLSYCSPIVALHICNELFSHILKGKEDYLNQNISWLGITQGEADNQACIIELPSFFIDSNWYKDGYFLLTKYFDGISLEQQSPKLFKLTIRRNTIFETFNLLALVAIFTHITNVIGVYTYIDNCLIEKYSRILTNLEHVPYFVFYLFNKRVVHSEKQFQILKPTFEAYLSRHGLTADLVYLDNYRQRISYITSLLSTDRDILDIGCGEFTYYKKMMNNGFQATYFAIDHNPEFGSLANNISNRLNANNLIFMTKIDEFVSDSQIDILLTEVIEHNTQSAAKELIVKSLSFDFNQIIITTPNVDFNPFYNMDSQMRHEDHEFELSQSEFIAWIKECTAHQNVCIEFFYLGDTLNGIQPTQGCVITKKK